MHFIITAHQAELNAAAKMRSWGFVDATSATGGSDGGIDVRSRQALAQVKWRGGVARSQTCSGCTGRGGQTRPKLCSSPPVGTAAGPRVRGWCLRMTRSECLPPGNVLPPNSAHRHQNRISHAFNRTLAPTPCCVATSTSVRAVTRSCRPIPTELNRVMSSSLWRPRAGFTITSPSSTSTSCV